MATTDPCFKQLKRRINEPLRKLLVSGVSMRRSAWILGVQYSTVARKLKFLAHQERISIEELLQRFRLSAISALHFDEMETFEHTKCKPLSIPLVVEPRHRLILSFDVAKMPAKGLLAEKSRKKYGPRVDQRPESITRVLSGLRDMVTGGVRILSDENPKYPRKISEAIPGSVHETTKGRRGCVVGQGELKSGGFDPLFSLNHTCAMIRANVNRMMRRTWCTTKKPECLLDHLTIYVGHHNRMVRAQS